jgi:hypothetical protein
MILRARTCFVKLFEGLRADAPAPPIAHRTPVGYIVPPLGTTACTTVWCLVSGEADAWGERVGEKAREELEVVDIAFEATILPLWGF